MWRVSVRGENNGGKGALPPSIGPMRQTCPTNILGLGGMIFAAKPQKLGAIAAVLEIFYGARMLLDQCVFPKIVKK